VPVRFTRDDLRTIEMAAKARKQTVSELVRRGLLVEAKVTYKGYLIELTAEKSESAGYESTGWITNQSSGFAIQVTTPGQHPTKDAALEAGIAWCKEKIDLGRTNRANT